MRARRIVALLLTATLLLAACGSDKDDDEGASGRTSTTDSSDEGSNDDEESSDADDQDLADALVLMASDLPDDFVEQDDDDSDDDDGPLDACLGDDADTLKDNTAKSDSNDFETDERFAFSSAAVFESRKKAEAAMEVFGAEGIRECFRDAVVDGIEEEAEADGDEPPGLDVTLDDLSFPDVGDEVVSFRANITITIEGQDLEFPFDVIFVRTGRAIGFYAFAALGESFPQADSRAAVESALARAA
ncbi:MAG: hypothetical protein ACRD1K_17850 [Acidimicrobiales bacterium]